MSGIDTKELQRLRNSITNLENRINKLEDNKTINYFNSKYHFISASCYIL